MAPSPLASASPAHLERAFFLAAERGRADVISKLLGQRPQLLGAQTASGETALHVTVANGRPRLRSMLTIRPTG